MKIETKRMKDGKPLEKEIKKDDELYEYDIVTGKSRVKKSVLNKRHVTKEELDSYFLQDLEG